MHEMPIANPTQIDFDDLNDDLNMNEPPCKSVDLIFPGPDRRKMNAARRALGHMRKYALLSASPPLFTGNAAIVCSIRIPIFLV